MIVNYAKFHFTTYSCLRIVELYVTYSGNHDSRKLIKLSYNLNVAPKTQIIFFIMSDCVMLYAKTKKYLILVFHNTLVTFTIFYMNS